MRTFMLIFILFNMFAFLTMKSNAEMKSGEMKLGNNFNNNLLIPLLKKPQRNDVAKDEKANKPDDEIISRLDSFLNRRWPRIQSGKKLKNNKLLQTTKPNADNVPTFVLTFKRN